MDNFSPLTRELNGILTKSARKEHGIFFTPKSYRSVVLDFVKKICDPKRILEPSFGSGEFIGDCVSVFPDSKIVGVELNTELYTKVSDHFKDEPRISLTNCNFLDFQREEFFDLIVGNPPYVVVNSGTPDEFKHITTGRPNLYCWFIYKSIKMLADNGILAFVIPNSILNTSYYELLRKFIIDICEILCIFEFDKKDFEETDQTTIGLILKKHSSENRKYVVEHKGRVFFNVHYEFVNKHLKTYPCIEDLGLGVKTGSVVWNQHKQHLRDDATQGKLLVYSSNNKGGKFVLFDGTQRNGKKQFIDLNKPTLKGPVILMNRGYGNSTYLNDLILVEDDTLGHREFYAENHLNVIYPTEERGKEIIRHVYEYLLTEKSKDYISKFVGNGALNKTEIATMLPVCLKEDDN